MPYAEESLWENVLRQQHKEVNGLDGFTFMHSPIPVILVVESHLSVICNIDDPGVGYGGTEGISGDILYDLVNSLGWRATVHDPCFLERLLPDVLRNKPAFLLQGGGEHTDEPCPEHIVESLNGEKKVTLAAA